MESRNHMDRRNFVKKAGVTAISFAVGASLWGCTKKEEEGGPKAKEASASQPSGHREPMYSKADAMAMVSKFEAAGVMDMGHPGKWKGKEGSHIPRVTLHKGEGAITLFTKHPMSKKHWITAHYLKDQNGDIIGFKLYKGTDPEARHRFEIPKGTTRITAYSHCNKHGDWKAEDKKLG